MSFTPPECADSFRGMVFAAVFPGIDRTILPYARLLPRNEFRLPQPRVPP